MRWVSEFGLDCRYESSTRQPSDGRSRTLLVEEQFVHGKVVYRKVSGFKDSKTGCIDGKKPSLGGVVKLLEEALPFQGIKRRFRPPQRQIRLMVKHFISHIPL